MIAVIHRGQKFKETMEAFQQKRVEFIAQEIRNFDAETLYVFLEWIRGNGHKLDRIHWLLSDSRLHRAKNYPCV